jgi:hypothetical protein
MTVDDGVRSHVNLEIALVDSHVLSIAKDRSNFLEWTPLPPISMPEANSGRGEFLP